jgi:para-nitrobenzyl esterase
MYAKLARHAGLGCTALFLAGCSSTPSTTPTPAPGPIDVTIESGPIHGAADESTRAFLGIPYAAPPVGPLRFMPPKPVAPWGARRDALAYGPTCMQLANDAPSPSSSEDCLYLNVWAPLADVKDAPVFVWIHGGGNVTGAGSETLYSGTNLAAKANAIVVTLNYRLGPFGFLSHPGLAKAEGVVVAPTQALLDQQAALAWVKRNIAAFGGDPKKVTVAGESAGGLAVCAQLAMPGSKDLFRAATIQSGPCVANGFAFAEPTRAADQGVRLATALGCPDDDAALTCMQSKPAASVLSALPLRKALFGAQGDTWSPVVDGVVLPKAPPAAYRAGELAKVPTLVGSNLNEGQLFRALWGSPPPTPADLRASFGLLFDGPTVDSIMAKYGGEADAGKAFSDALGDMFTCIARQTVRNLTAGGAPAYLYQFVYPYSVAAFPGLVTTHAFELPLLFRNGFAGAKLSDDDLAMADVMDGYWMSLARSGDPNATRASGTGAWPLYQNGTDEHLVLDRVPAPGKGLKSATCDFWDGISP